MAREREGTEIVSTVYFVTNRNPNRKRNPDDFGPHFSSKDLHDLRFGRAEVVESGGRRVVASIQVADEKLDANPSRARLGSNAMFLDLRGAMRSGVDTLVFIHGYNVSFHEALVAGARLVETYGSAHPLNVVVFSWPSDGSILPLLAYKSDRADARASGPALARALLRLRDFLEKIRRGEECRAKAHLMAHSMGNYVLRNGLVELRSLKEGGVPLLFDQMFLMAADEDHDAFEHEHKLAALPELAAGVSIYFNRGDTALVISDRTKLNPTRLGTHGPRLPLAVPGNVTIVDTSEVVAGIVEHGYFIEDPTTVRDVREMLRGTPADRIPHRRYVASQNRYVLSR
jgi:esterase/lipase superfamily enzyme